jgi:hypothetical protein
LVTLPITTEYATVFCWLVTKKFSEEPNAKSRQHIQLPCVWFQTGHPIIRPFMPVVLYILIKSRQQLFGIFCLGNAVRKH